MEIPAPPSDHMPLGGVVLLWCIRKAGVHRVSRPLGGFFYCDALGLDQIIAVVDRPRGCCHEDRRAPCPIANKGNDVVRISSRTWTLAQIEDLAALIAAGSTAANAAVALRRSITVVRAKARNLGTPFQIIAEDRLRPAIGRRRS